MTNGIDGSDLLEPTLNDMYRMPTVFGPAPGPRNVPKEKSHLRYSKDWTILSVAALTDRSMLSQLLPPRCKLDGEPTLRVSMTYLTNIGWLAGRGYNILMVRIPAIFEGEHETVKGTFIPVLWESMTDPILTGREELGWPKIHAEIPDPVVLDGSWHGTASWQGYRFFDIGASEFKAQDSTPPAEGPAFVHKYIPRTGEWGKPDVSYMAVTGNETLPTITSFAVGTGRFTFRSARWEDMPTQYRVVNSLAALPIVEFREACLTRGCGGGDVSSQRIVR